MVMAFMAVSVIMISMAVPMLVLFCQYGRPETVRMQISHIVVMILMFAVKDHVEIAGIQAGLDNTRDCNPVTGKRQRIQCFLQQLFIRPQIQKRRNQHISADSAGTVKNQRFSSFFQSFLHNLIPCSFPSKHSFSRPPHRRPQPVPAGSMLPEPIPHGLTAASLRKCPR